ncbi:MAG: hypothetical protein GC129_06630 [Proteobacteria bacterium]|nr:hypothetical protein [Pseudomonadota bacterium]
MPTDKGPFDWIDRFNAEFPLGGGKTGARQTDALGQSVRLTQDEARTASQGGHTATAHDDNGNVTGNYWNGSKSPF